MKPKILKVWIEHRLDDQPDTSHLGQYASKPTSQFSIDRREQGDMNRNEYQFFNPSFNYVDGADKLRDGLKPHEVTKYVQEDYRRMETLNQGDWHYIGITARAEVQLTDSTVQTIRSGGLWGVESDSGDTYLDEVANEELAALRAELTALGFTNAAITRAFTNVLNSTPALA